MNKLLLALVVFVSAVSVQAAGLMRITEYMYNGTATGGVGEFVEFTNIGDAAVDMTGWSFDDSSRLAGSQSLSAFGVVQPSQSVILTDATAPDFKTQWGLINTVVIGGNANNLGRADEINLYDGSNTLIDRLTYDDQTLGSPRTNKVSAWTALANLASNDSTKWQLSVAGDAQHSYTSTLGDLGNPGTYVVPEPVTAMLLTLGGMVCAARRRARA